MLQVFQALPIRADITGTPIMYICMHSSVFEHWASSNNNTIFRQMSMGLGRTVLTGEQMSSIGKNVISNSEISSNSSAV